MDKNRTMLIAQKKALSSVSLFFLPISFLFAQQDTDFMRSMGKMYVVVAVILAIFIGIIIYLIRLDRKLTKLEDQIKNHE
jgi:CcmD family protein